MSAPKAWYEYLFELLAGLFAKQQLEQAGASSADLATATTAVIDLPTFGEPERQPPTAPESRDVADLHPELQRRYAALKADFRAQTGRDLFETCTWRSQAEQERLFQIGRRGIPGEKTVTQLDGVTKKSRHMVYPAEAVDVCVDADPGPGKHPVWDRAAYELLGPLALQHGLIWGGTWRIDDYPHLELPAGAA